MSTPAEKPTPTRGDMMLMGRYLASVALLGHTGAREFETAYDDDDPERIRWWCGALWKGAKLHSHHFPYPAQAAEDLLARAVNGGFCKRCNRTTIVGVAIDGFCCLTLRAENVDIPHSYRWVRTCEEPS